MNLSGENKVIKRKNGSRRVQFICKGESKTRQSQKEESEISNIINKYKQTGVFTHVASMLPQFGDASEVEDYKSAVDAVHRANEAFLELSSELRTKFKNDPGQLIAYLADPKNDKEAISLGLRKAPAPIVHPHPHPDDNAPEKAASNETQPLQK